MRRSCILAARAAARDGRVPDASDAWRAYRHTHARAAQRLARALRAREARSLVAPRVLAQAVVA